MFIDEVEIEALAGSGGNGMATFRKEKYVPFGGPSGGDGGKGGSVFLKADANLTTLLDFRYMRKHKAQRGGDGGSKDMFGKDGEDLILSAPIGTIVTDLDTGDIIADLTHHGQIETLARGGIGGKGNAHFATSTHQAPKFAEKGEPGEGRRIKMELKLMADVGLLGYPNVGKSTLITAVSAARPKIASYPFTTLVPNLGVVKVETERNFVMADIPGIIEGASEGIGLGHQFLKHVSRSRLLIHILDVSGLSGRDPLEDFEILNRELALYDERLPLLPQIVALNKIDAVQDPDMVETVRSALAEKGYTVYLISAIARQGLKPLLYDVMGRLEALRAEDIVREAEEGEMVVFTTNQEEDDRRWMASQAEEHVFEVKGKGLERKVAMADLENAEALRRLQRYLEKTGVYRRLKLLGAQHGDTVRIRDIEFEYQDDERIDQEFGEMLDSRRKQKKEE